MQQDTGTRTEQALASQSTTAPDPLQSFALADPLVDPLVCEVPDPNQATIGPALRDTAATGPAEPPDDTTWWKTAPKLEIPWPPGSDKQSKHAISWDGGPKYDLAFPERKWPSDGRETLFEAPPVQVPTPVPGVVLDLFAKAEYGLAFGGAVGFAIKKKGEGAYDVSGEGSVKGKAAIGVTGGVGVGVGGAGVSIGVSGNLAATLEAALSGTIKFTASYAGGRWSGKLEAPLKFEAQVKVTPSASLYVKVVEWNQELANLSFGDWIIATAGAEWTPGIRLDGDGFSNETREPKLIGPTWGSPPEAKEV